MIYQVEQDVDLGKLKAEIAGSGCMLQFDGLTLSGDRLEVHGKVSDQQALDALVSGHEASSLADEKAAKAAAIDARTAELILNGFTFDGREFPLTQQDQACLLDLSVSQGAIAWPATVATSGDGEYQLALSDVAAFVNGGMRVVRDSRASGLTLKVAANAAQTREELALVVDSR